MKFSILLALALSYTTLSSAQGQNFRPANADKAEQLTKEFANLTKDSPCDNNAQACVEDQFAQCVGGKFQLNSCGGGELKCVVLPLVNKPGTSITCSTEADRLARLADARGENNGNGKAPGNENDVKAPENGDDGKAPKNGDDLKAPENEDDGKAPENEDGKAPKNEDDKKAPKKGKDGKLPPDDNLCKCPPPNNDGGNGKENDNEDGGNENDNEDGGNENDNKDGGNENDNKDGGNENDNKDGGNENDNEDGGNENDNEDGGNENDNEDGGNENDNEDGGNENDNEDGGNENDNKDGGNENDNKDGGNENDNKDGGNGDGKAPSDNDKLKTPPANGDGNLADIRKQNAADAKALQKKFDALKPDDKCNDNDVACVDNKFAQCSGGKFALSDCASGTICAALPLVLKKGTTVACTTEADRDARLKQSETNTK